MSFCRAIAHFLTWENCVFKLPQNQQKSNPEKPKPINENWHRRSPGCSLIWGCPELEKFVHAVNKDFTIQVFTYFDLGQSQDFKLEKAGV